MRVGAMRKYVTVTGPRAWVHTPLLGWSLTQTVPTRSVDLPYEFAFGGEGFEANPVGIGVLDTQSFAAQRMIPAPRILTADGRAPRFGEPYPVEGFGALARTWNPRKAFGGTPGAAPLDLMQWPDGFDMRFFCAAPPDLVGDGFLRGHEEARLLALHPAHAEFAFRLPSLLVAVGAVHASGFRHGSPARLDTIVIDADVMRVELTWRATMPVYKGGIESLHVAMRPLDNNVAGAP
ncbi:DUF2169 domain-containing protein [Polyangium fumosum]|uniref:DUF2169 domain-containing protein n=1 Tax=Polyangium fumosum TaxID=889272 RepID=A0A4U1JKA3_9BACT|nr:DUF2169 domain-containing protein [Polyangium fumosum]